MNIVAPKARKTTEIELTPLINIVFLMLIFFLLAGSLKPGEVIEPVRAMSGEAAASPPLSRTITLMRNGSLLLGDTPVDRQDLIRQLTANGANRAPLSIKPDAGLEAAELVELMRLLRQGGFLSVQLLSIADSGKR